MLISAAGPTHLHADSDRWAVRASVVRGESHVRRDSVCQDCFAADVRGRRFVAVAADGAGSAPRSDQGSLLAARAIVSALLAPETRLTRVSIIDAMATARAALADEATQNNERVDDYATTVVGAAMQGSNGIFFHLGDGLALAFGFASESSEVRAISTGTPSDFANVSSFLTQADWQSNIVFTPVRAADSLMLMTDGFSPFALDRRGKPKPRFYQPILDFMRAHPGSVGAQGLTDMMNTPVVRKTSGDDCTLIWAGLREQA
ncbi:hypothetical protein H6CHR_03278 [Variovorax sp. PBL-H6]|uniref:protein phosphatase 2C domain-containing protein n=1 Tax=Variovorax sp. PBL-H6 TaxID=434009 RepID=UPI0013197F40|nr:protein phosphatase 2C domain-containing protein [Variovorax sp. PBL-H6]VTU29851.1 hypothetical protein H6CHR_03278 [Variovorax sp. PBL-H6]